MDSFEKIRIEILSMTLIDKDLLKRVCDVSLAFWDDEMKACGDDPEQIKEILFLKDLRENRIKRAERAAENGQPDEVRYHLIGIVDQILIRKGNGKGIGVVGLRDLRKK